MKIGRIRLAAVGLGVVLAATACSGTVTGTPSADSSAVKAVLDIRAEAIEKSEAAAAAQAQADAAAIVATACQTITGTYAQIDAADQLLIDRTQITWYDHSELDPQLSDLENAIREAKKTVDATLAGPGLETIQVAGRNVSNAMQAFVDGIGFDRVNGTGDTSWSHTDAAQADLEAKQDALALAC